ncbi:hypothetical protein BUALT_Bualt17G0054700 [Buddleja alternifolia]|uniref:Protein WVD2-like 7 n=1 Tax=Buddleja alternifolia TaxID=168488 RepID=A0AAV6W7W6_9LAMI|nr:hypothetical protein BUALT_Bualt17G0054700 [Buddleja alternifolia]
MDQSVKSEGRLEVSVSFGRFENDALSWEKFSAFSPNKYLEEVGNLSTPGSVAQKKAYFEAHYKKIAAKKAEELEQEKSIGTVNPNPDVSSKDDHVENSYEIDAKFCASNGERLVEEVEQEACITSLENVTIAGERLVDVEKEACITSLENVTIADETKDDNSRSSEGLDQEAFTNSVIPSKDEKEEAKDELNDNLVNPEMNVKEESVMVEVEIPNKVSRKILEKPQVRKNGVEQLKKQNSKLNAQNIVQKVTPTKKDRNLTATKKKVVSLSAKPSQTSSTPRYSKPPSMSTPISASQSLKKKVNGSPLPKSKNLAAGQSKRAGPTSMHMSLSLDPTNPVANLSSSRKSLIMEKMGDKDIVKRAFKTFQNRSIGSYSDEKPSIVKHVASNAFEPKISSFRTPIKGNDGLRKDAQKMATPRSQSGTRSNPLPSGSHKSSTRDRKNTSVFSPAIGLRNDEKAVKRKEEEKKSEIKKLSQSHNSDAKPKSSFYEGRGKII